MSEGQAWCISDSTKDTKIHRQDESWTTQSTNSLSTVCHIKQEPDDYMTKYGSTENAKICDNIKIKTEFGQTDYPTRPNNTSYSKIFAKVDTDTGLVDIKKEIPSHSSVVHTWKNIPLVYIKPESYNSPIGEIDISTHTSTCKGTATCKTVQSYECKQCGERLKNSIDLTVHMRTHTGDKPFGCEQCGKRFTYSSALTVHMRTHTGEKPYECEQCGKRFTKSGDLIRHIRTHTGDKPHKCEQCGKRFIQSSALTVHMRTHTGDKPYKCEQCGKRFTQRGELTRHMRTHFGDKPYGCEQCGKRFTESGTLKTHMTTHTGDKPCKCEQCGKRFTYNRDLTVHMRIHTG